MKIYRVVTPGLRYRYLSSKEQAKHEQAWINSQLGNGEKLEAIPLELPKRLTRRAICAVLNMEVGYERILRR